MMKALTFTLLFVVCTLQIAKAQFDDKHMLYANKVQKFGKLKRIGTTMAAGGAIMTATGIVLVSRADWYTTYSSNGSSQLSTDDPDGITGYYLTMIGLPITIGGVVLAIIGNKKEKQYMRKLEDFSAGYFQYKGTHGITIRLRL
ncbi:hypothetical protein [Fulvivirga ligni]|uniref:hypothetical protein n=1 Tax=Fulvivirga ligni TaxID=2904246 RepID=UPI001F4093A0|nr:hypothetical protein [Fulvivirga ligni]UII22485.1 hypothetical protein LVD16_04485 [Fulvivirga ligni]